MELKSKIQKKKEIDIINSRLVSKNKACELSLLNIINNINSKDKKSHLENKERNSFTKKNIIIYYLIILLLTQMIFSTNCQNRIISNDSIITLKVSQSGEQKIFNSGTEPDKILIDYKEQEIYANHSYYLNITNTVELIWTKDIMNCSYMFSECYSIIEINFTNFDARKCYKVGNMFANCQSLISLDLSGFITKNNLISMANMFWGCHSLISLNLSTFDTPNVTNFGNLLTDCKSLTSIDISKISTKKAEYLDNMFKGCTSLISLNLSHFFTSKVKKIDNMFNGCKSLKGLDLSNFDITSVTNIETVNNIFLNCESLNFINLKNLNSNIKLGNNFFTGTPKNLVIIINADNTSLIDISNNNSLCMAIHSDDNWSDSKYKINTEDNSCVENCFGTNYQYEYNFKCYPECFNRTYIIGYKCEDCHPDCEECEGPYTQDNSNCKTCASKEKFLYFGNCIGKCPKGNYINETTNQQTCNCELEQCSDCTIESLSENLCTSCDKNSEFYPIYDDSNNPYLNCSRSPEGYYLDKIVYKLCFSTCKTCNILGNEDEHNCLDCKNGYNYEMKYEHGKNCYEQCSYYYYVDKNINVNYCTLNDKCPEYYDKLIEPKRECAFNCSQDDLYKFEFKKKCYNDCPSGSIRRKNSKELEGSYLDFQYFCKPICNKDKPYEIIKTQECIESCDIEKILNKECILNYQEGKKQKMLQLLMLY